MPPLRALSEVTLPCAGHARSCIACPRGCWLNLPCHAMLLLSPQPCPSSSCASKQILTQTPILPSPRAPIANRPCVVTCTQNLLCRWGHANFGLLLGSVACSVSEDPWRHCSAVPIAYDRLIESSTVYPITCSQCRQTRINHDPRGQDTIRARCYKPRAAVITHDAGRRCAVCIIS
jgi:hypothetical protein